MVPDKPVDQDHSHKCHQDGLSKWTKNSMTLKIPVLDRLTRWMIKMLLKIQIVMKMMSMYDESDELSQCH